MEPLKIIPPKGFEIDLDKSDYKTGEIHLKKIENLIPSYKKICDKLLYEEHFYITAFGKIATFDSQESHKCPNTAPTKEQLESILNLNKLCNVAKYLNDGWLPDWNKLDLKKCIIIYDHFKKRIDIVHNTYKQDSSVCFKTYNLAEQAITILGEETIKSALTLNH